MGAGQAFALAAAAVLMATGAAGAELSQSWRTPPPPPGGLVGLLREPPPIDADLVLRYRNQYLSPDAFFEDVPVADRLGREQLAALKEQIAYEQAREVADVALDRVLRASPVFVEISRFEEARRIEEFFGAPVEPEPRDVAPAAPAPPPVPRKAVERSTLPGGISIRVGAKIGVTRFEPALQAIREPFRTRVSYSVTDSRLESTLGFPLLGPVGFDAVYTWHTDEGEHAFRFTVSLPF